VFSWLASLRYHWFVCCIAYCYQGCNSQEVAFTWKEMTSRDLTWPEATSFGWKSPGSGCMRPKNQVLSVFILLQSCNSQEVAFIWLEMTSRDLTWPEVTRMVSFGRKSPGNGCRMKTQVLGAFMLLQVVTCRRWQSRNRKSPQVTSRVRVIRKWRHLAKSPGSGCRRLKTRVLRLCSYTAVTSRRWH